MTTHPPSLLVTLAQTAILLGCSRSKVYDLRRQGLLNAVYLGKSPRFRRSEIMSLVSGQRTTALRIGHGHDSYDQHRQNVSNAPLGDVELLF